MQSILWFSEISKDDIPKVGGKGANLGELTKAGLPVPEGYCVTAEAYYYFLDKTKIRDKILEALSGLDVSKTKDLNESAKKAKNLILKSKIPAEIEKEIKKAYQKLGEGKNIYVACRSSATAEDLPDASFAGQQATFLNVSGGDAVVKAVLGCWASLFEPRAIFYREEKGFDHFKVGIAVPVQKMVQSEKSGVMFTIDPVDNNQEKITIEAGYGLGELVVLGAITPDRYWVDKKTLKILDKEINSQDWMLVRGEKGKGKKVQIQEAGDEGVNVRMDVSKDKKDKQKLTDEEIIKLAEIGKKIEDHYSFPQDTEWAFEEGKIYMLQSRPVTTMAVTKSKKKTGTASTKEIILKGAGASFGQSSGPVRIILKVEDSDKINEGEVLVTEMTTPDFVPAMKKSAAIVTNTGGRTCHAAIVSRELGIPCVVGTSEATKKLKDGEIITVDGAKGLIYEGELEAPEQVKKEEGSTTVVEQSPVTATKVYVNLAEPEMAEEVAQKPVDGVGLLRAEFIIAAMGEHPRKMMEEGRSEEFVEKLADGLSTFASAFAPRPVIYRATDFKTNEYRNLAGGDKYEPHEENPMIGYRGCFRYIKEPDLFKLEIAAIKKVREEQGLNNLHLMIPFVRTIDEMVKVKKILTGEGLERSNDFKLLIMVEVPSTVILIDEFCELGIDGVSIGSNDLTQLTLGVDRDSSILAEEFDERNEAVLLSLKKVIEACQRHKVTVSICGQAPSVYPEITEFLVEAGMTSVSVNPDVIDQTRKLIASVEQKILLKKLEEVEEIEEDIKKMEEEKK
jgi:pyruvate,water dikinase